MRWCVSVGALLILGAIVGGEVSNAAAENLGHQLIKDDRPPSVDLELVIAVDVSYSMDIDELVVQREGYAQAIVSKEFLQALKPVRTEGWLSPISSGPHRVT